MQWPLLTTKNKLDLIFFRMAPYTDVHVSELVTTSYAVHALTRLLKMYFCCPDIPTTILLNIQLPNQNMRAAQVVLLVQGDS